MAQRSAVFVFKLRRNIVLEGDLALAEREIAAFFARRPEPLADLAAAAADHPALAALDGLARLAADVRPSGIQGYRTSGDLGLLPDLVRALSFASRIYAVFPGSVEEGRAAAAGLEAQVGPVCGAAADPRGLVVHAVPHNALLELSDVAVRRARTPGEVPVLLDLMLAVLTGRDTGIRGQEVALAALGARQTTAHAYHDLHYYKAKFFPRMVRSTLNFCARRLGRRPRRVLDPFAGSGTSLVESSLLGFPSAGYDLDPLSVLITRVKLQAMRGTRSDMARTADRALEALAAARRDGGGAAGVLSFPAWLLKNRRFTPDVATMLSAEIRHARAILPACDPEWRDLGRVLISDALSRRLRMRLLGTGVGRFSLGLSATPLPDILARSLARAPRVAAAVEWLRDRLRLTLAEAQVCEADARQPAPDRERFDLVLTSQPYLPASSGRETYAKARALSFLALEMLERDGVDSLIGDAVGSMGGQAAGWGDLSADEAALVRWLASDELRAIKAEPTARYFRDMRAAFRQMREALVPGGMAVVVSGRQSTFYEFATRTPLYVAESARLLAEGAQAAGFEVEELLDVQLAKANMNARPRALDEYYETLIFLRRA